MNRRVWGIIIVIAALAITAGIVYIIFIYRFSSSPAPAADQPAALTVAPAADQPAAPAPARTSSPAPAVSPLKKTEVGRDDLIRLGSAFAERFGSFSNQSDYGNIKDLQIFMTASLKAWSDNYINDARTRKGDSTIYYGIITKSISGEVKRFDPDLGKAEILVKTQRRESIGVSGNGPTFYQDLLVKYSREDGGWLLDGLHWQAK